MLKKIDEYLNAITMYRLILYYLIAILTGALVLSGLGVIRYSIPAIFFSTLFLIVISWAANIVFARVYNAPVNVESVYISALILALIISPASTSSGFIFLGWAAIITMASKYIFNIGHKHLFNPVAIGVVITSFIINQSASWWVGTLYMLPFVFVGGLLMVRKIRRFKLVLSFFVVALLTMIGITLFQGKNIITLLSHALLDSPFFFFAFVMFTEPLTTPPTAQLQMIYGAIVGFLFAPQIHLGTFYTTPEIALVIGNIYSYLVSPKAKVVLTLTEKIMLTPDTYDFVFTPSSHFDYRPGQYMEWTLEHPKSDDRGNRRYFTLASSPTESTLRLGIKFYSQSSSYKNTMLAMDQNTPIVAAQLAGDFTLPLDKKKKLVFIAGGIGITPFRSMIKYLVDKQESRDIVLFYANKSASEIVYQDVFSAAIPYGVKTIYTLSDTQNIPTGWTGYTGRIDSTMITKEVPDFYDRSFYLSGPHTMVTAYIEILKDLGVSSSKIKTDFFPGFA